MVAASLLWQLPTGVAAQASKSAALAAPPSAQDAPIALLIDAGSGQVLFERNADMRFIPASITKIMTAYVAFEMLADGRLSPGQRVTVTPDTFRQWNRVGSTMFVPHDAVPTIDELLHGITTVSANDASAILADAGGGSMRGWTGLMNAQASSLDMRDSFFGTPNGWPDEGVTFTTARDLTVLSRALITRHPSLYAHFFGNATYRYNNITQTNHDPLIGRVEGADGLKTGYTNQAGYGFVGSVKRGGRRLIMVVAGSPRGRVRDAAARNLITWGFAAFETRNLFTTGSIVGRAMVQEGDATSVPLYSASPITIASATGARSDYTLSIRYEGPIRAPIAKDAQIATLQVQVGEQDVSEVPLLAAHSIAVAGPFARLRNAVVRWFR